MTSRSFRARFVHVCAFLVAGSAVVVNGADILRTSGFTVCQEANDITVRRLDIQYNRPDRIVTFDVSGSSAKVQNVTASLLVTAYGRQVYKKDFDPCDPATKVSQLCPVPAGNFEAKGTQEIPSNYAAMIPDIAFQVPDLDGVAKLSLKPAGGGKDLACIQSPVQNGKTTSSRAVSYVSVGIAGAALLFSGAAAAAAIGVGAGGAAGAGAGAIAPSPTFTEVFGWMQSMALNGMLSVNYPPVYRSFTRNFAFSGGLVSWTQMQTSIDNFRSVTGGNLTTDSVAYLRNATLVYEGSATSSSFSSGNATAAKVKRALDTIYYDGLRLEGRGISTSVNGSQSNLGGGANGTNSTLGDSKTSHLVHGIQAYAEQLTIPQSNTFMTVLLVFACAVAAVAVGILLFKLILELWALFRSFPKALVGFRKRYWGFLGRTIVNMILLLYGIWTLYCVFQFTHGDSWAAKLLAGVTLTAFTGILGFFTFRIWQLAQRYKKAEGDTSVLFEDKRTWRKYSLFYDQYKRDVWWLFVPAIIYMFAKGCIIAAADGHGLVQTSGQLIVEALMLALLLWHRPYATKAGNWINIFIQVVRVLSVVCILIFVEELGVKHTTKTVTGVVLIAMQSTLTAALAILIAVNAFIICCRENPHRRRRKEAEKLQRDLDNLAPLDPRNSLLMEPTLENGKYVDDDDNAAGFQSRYSDHRPARSATFPFTHHQAHDSSEALVPTAAAAPYSAASPMVYGNDGAGGRTGSVSRDGGNAGGDVLPVMSLNRQPTVPNVGYR